MQKQKTRINRFAFIIPFLLLIFTCGIYFHNLSPSVFGGDVGDFISAIVTYGVPHPSGYPLFTMLGILSNNLPFGVSVAWKIGIISVLSASFSVVLLYVLVDWIVKNKLIAGISALYMAFFSIFWLYAEIAEIFSLTILFILLLFVFGLLYYKTKKNTFLYILSFLAGLSLTHHEIIVAIFPSIAILVLSANWKIIKNPIFLVKCIGLFLVGLLPYIYIPIAASHHPLISWDKAYNLQNFVHLVTRGDYGWQPTSSLSFIFKMLAVNVYMEKMITELTPAGSLVIFLGMVQCLRKKQFALFFALFLGFFLTGPFYVWYGFIPLTTGFIMGVVERFYLISSVFLFVFFGLGLEFLGNLLTYIIPTKNTKRKLFYKYAIILVFLILPLSLLKLNFPKTDLHNLWVGDNLGKDVLNPLPKNSVLALEGDTLYFNTLYERLALGVRKDVTLTSLISLNNDKNVMKDIATDTGGKEVPSDVKFLLALKSFSNRVPVFATTQLQFKDNLFPHIAWIPYGFLFKIATAEELQMKEPQFVAMQEKILKQMHLPESFSQTAVVFHNLTISDIPAVYAQGYVNIGDYILAHYGDVMLAQAYYMRAIDTYPYLASSYTGMGYVYLSQNNCKMAQNQFINAQQIDPTKRAPYMALYLSYLNCSKEPQKAEEVASNFSKNFGGSILDAIKVTQGFH